MSTQQIYVACLAAYNNGILHGAWIDLDEVSDSDELFGIIKSKVLATSPIPNAEEWAVHDYDGIPLSSLWGEWPNFDRLLAFVELYREHGEAFVEWLGMDCTRMHNDDPSGWSSRFQDAYVGEFESGREYAEQFYEECGLLENIPTAIRYHIDWEAVWSCELRHGVDYTEPAYGKTFIFNQE